MITNDIKKIIVRWAVLIAFFAVSAMIILIYRDGFNDTNIMKAEKEGFSLDTFVSITVYSDKSEEDAKKAAEGAMQLCRSYEKIFSPEDTESELYRINSRLPEVSRLTAGEEIRHVIDTGLKFGELSEGAFDITVLPLKKVWGFSGEKRENLPKSSEISEALSRVDYKKVSLEGDEIVFASPGIMIDLGAVAKGYIADRIKEYLLGCGIRNALINLGGNILCLGDRNGKKYRIGIQDPVSSDKIYKSVEISDCSIVTSGTYERYVEIDGRQYHHILDTKTGYPVENGLLSVSVTAESSEIADALSTVCLCVGEEKGKNIAEMFGADTLFIDK